MIFIPDNEVLGELTVQDIFVYFDGPRLFVAANAAGQRYLVNCIDAEDTSDTWLAVAVSDRRLFALKDGAFEIRNAFNKPELGRVYELVVDKRSGDLIRVITRNPNELPDEELPEPGVLIAFETAAEGQVNAALLARQLNSSVVLLRLFSNSQAEAPAKSVGDILSSFEQYISTKLDRALNAATGLIEAAQRPFQVNIVGTFAGSFGIEIAVRGSDARIASTLKNAIEELNSADELDGFRERMLEVADDEAEAMRRFMSKIADAGSDLTLETASQNDSEPHFAKVPLPRVRAAVKTLKREPKVGTQTRKLVGELIGLNLRTRKFELKDVETGEQIIGSMAAPIFTELEKAQLPSRYRVALEGDLRAPKRGAQPIVTTWKMVSATRLG